MEENLKLKNLLKRVLENNEFVYSFEDTSWDGDDRFTEKYTIEYHIEVHMVTGKGSDAVASVDIIIDDILMDGESVYLGWSEIGYSENVWYIDNLLDELYSEVFINFPFSIYPTVYGHDEEKKS